jgi:glucose-1-phosphate cytidylyltransferase
MIDIGGMPILWHIMKTYSFYGFNEFILCLGYKGQIIKDYFYNYDMRSNDFTIDIGSNKVTIHPRHSEQDWIVTLVDTGLNTMTGGRIRRIERFIDDDVFMMTYGDGVTDLNINKLLQFHLDHKKIGTVTGVFPPSRYGVLKINRDQVASFDEKPLAVDNSISGGYFIFNKEFFSLLKDDTDCVLEKEPLEQLVADGELKVFTHKGFWQCMDTYRDYKYLTGLWQKGEAPWKIW